MPFNVIVRYTETKNFLVVSKVPSKYTVGQFQDHLLKLSILTSDISNYKITHSGISLDPITLIQDLKTDDSSNIFVFAEGVRPIDDCAITFGGFGYELKPVHENPPSTTDEQSIPSIEPNISAENAQPNLPVEPQNTQLYGKTDPNFNSYEVENIMDTPTPLDIRQRFLINVIIILTVLIGISFMIANFLSEKLNIAQDLTQANLIEWVILLFALLYFAYRYFVKPLFNHSH
ncbi:hypothetical protein TVAG_317520 [Trichomonas vaginalis G3]|uniref:Uncharacterized protein n=1 Tax=Trichomonas vaginalis (strain ATCC PRA-98 / G3) TaxID=412133 RepID=A2FTK1_TRIV3|nr:hypothetical protein TVAGG3_0476790 [Trichomonas vaginalis G3]EAX91763.1 hypothetical protein TVAG_317520 [Trichomonas vaginalis G3]KAI5515460.1 hypothetical protein TVAGG3_0476790 [Trichomonas vaginalis G3]|eukprot:XP_001304693.1 hypothetical protein [Trichomonas vaginalis G3]